MKKNIFKFGALCLLAAGLLTSCEEEKVMYGGPDFVTLDQAAFNTMTVRENGGTVSIPVLLTHPLSSDLSVTYTVTSTDAQAGTNYVLINPTLVIPAGETSGNIQIQIIDDEDVNLSRKLELTLTGTSMDNVQAGIGQDGSFHKTITIQNNDYDCPSEFNYWLGNLNIEDVGYDTTPGVGTAGALCDILTVEGNLAADTADGNRTFKIHFYPTSEDGTVGTVEVEPTFVRQIESGGTTYDATYVGDGTYSTITGKITIAYSFDAYLGGESQGSFWDGTTVITLAE